MVTDFLYAVGTKNPGATVWVKNAASLDEKNTDEAVWSDEIFELHDIDYTDEEIELTKEKVTDLFYKYKIDFPEKIHTKRND